LVLNSDTKGKGNEENFSATQSEEEEQARFSRADEDERRPHGVEASSRERKKELNRQ